MDYASLRLPTSPWGLLAFLAFLSVATVLLVLPKSNSAPFGVAVLLMGVMFKCLGFALMKPDSCIVEIIPISKIWPAKQKC